MRILIVEDQENLAKLVKSGLEDEGFAVDYVTDGEAGFRRIELYHDDYDLIILDIMMPKLSGIDVCKKVRELKIFIPIIMLTAKDGQNDIINGLNVGADDYLAKPFTFDILLARIRAVLRRPKTALPAELKIQDIILDTTAKKVFRNSKEVRLTLKEFSLLEYLMRHPNQAVNREQILSNVWDFAFDSFANVVDVHITNLRKKIGDRNAKIIETVRGLGYRINA
ncbi:DNA-binding response regulator [Candidatus Parcubacteria bacterium]|nr:MAG: DNA-binding response regulator [Candidatus Parcubacteria bacterium]